MGFCYKLITETPGRSNVTSSSKRSTTANKVPSSIFQLISSFNYEHSNDALDSIPEHDWRLLAALARKREDDCERERLADQFREMWLQEKREREIAEAETSYEYKRFLHKKRQQERSWHECRQLQRAVQQHVRRDQLINCIRSKEQRSADVIASVDDKKASELVSKAIEEHARAQLAADRRLRLGAALHYRRALDCADAQRRADDARHRRDAILRDASQRLAISNALSSWESAVVRQEQHAAEATRRACIEVSAARASARAMRTARERDKAIRSARRLAALTARLREAIRTGHL